MMIFASLRVSARSSGAAARNPTIATAARKSTRSLFFMSIPPFPCLKDSRPRATFKRDAPRR
jgi:hypothetical protein